ncbi:hypothetical protein AWB74_08580 [Caballeronia arvi]|uniref:Lipoprotein n=1 Tax=Caballeronia arvi TaxID=1777135 RepID=A0A158L4V7_9BURK|nr:hypothetical protein [Caballeronia arvi]SAL88474.1 hypothetical protein AWB74_08580 [Caballeronia arvi]
MKSSITLKALLIAAMSAGICLVAGCNRGHTGASSAAGDTSAAAPASVTSAPAAGSFPATAASDAPSGASQ